MDKETIDTSSEPLENERANPANKFLFIGVAIVFFGVFLGGTSSNGSFSTFSIICVFIACLFITYSSVIVVIRKEAPRPGLPSIRGVGAVISGLLVIVTAGFGGLIILVSFIKDLLHK